MKKPLLILLQLLLLIPVFGQDLNIEWGDDFDSKTEIQKIMGVSGDHMVAYTMKGKRRYIETYDKSGFKLDNTAEYTLPVIGGKKSGLLNITLSGGNVASLLYVYNRKTKSFSLFSQILTIQGKPIGKVSEIYDSGVNDDKIRDRRVSAVFSSDNKKALVYFDRTNKERTDFYSDIIIIIDLENDLEIIGETKHAFKIRDSKSEKIDFNVYHSVENDGSYSFIQEKYSFHRQLL